MAAALRPSPAILRRPPQPSASLRRVPLSPCRLRSKTPAFPLLSTAASPLLLRGRRARGGAAAGTTAMDTAASSYAAALADVAKSNGTLDATAADVEKVGRIFSEPSVQSFFANPTIALEKKMDMVAEIATSAELQPHTTNFLNILVDMRRIDIVKDIAKEFEDCYNRITGTEVAVVSSVVRLESRDLAQIAQAVQRLTGAKNVRIKTVIDPTLIAGLTIRFGASGSKLIDMSVKKQLDEIASQFDFSQISLA